METTSTKKVYFFSDAHLGIPDHASSLQRERLMVEFLEHIRKDALAIYLMGDLFDFWFEYKAAIPKGYARLLGKLAEITDSGIPIFFFRGNHDIWAFDYLQKELNIQIERKPMIKEILGKRFYLAHGDGLGKGDYGYKFLKSIFECKINQFLFRWIHPDIGIRAGLFFSRRNRYANEIYDQKTNYINRKVSLSETRLPKYAKEILASGEKIDYFVMGHYHRKEILNLDNNAKFIFLGDWISLFSYGVFDGTTFKLETFKSAN
ncbi:MAG: UDP-2,3-diacylglucosamine diphosphatase [Bacteroidales bacterium]|nr:UDP-2,3-diacylglucosamine diphosphatase [Bacteroidales bacterium]